MERQASLETRRGQVHPELHSAVEPCVMHYMGAAVQPISIALLMEALTALSQSGSSKQRLLALDALGIYPHRKDGHRRVTQ